VVGKSLFRRSINIQIQKIVMPIIIRMIVPQIKKMKKIGRKNRARGLKLIRVFIN